MATNFTPDYAIHPGEFIKEEIEDLNISQKELAERTNISKTVINEIINGKRNINADIAIKLEEVLYSNARYWLNLQAIYNEALTRKKLGKPSYESIPSPDEWDIIENVNTTKPNVVFSYDNSKTLRGDISNKKMQSVLVMKKLYFSKILFNRDGTAPQGFSAKFTPEYKNLEGDEIEVALTCQIKSESKFMLEVVLVGVFENTEQDEKMREEINKLNTLTIMFPYLRSEISLLTTQPDFPSINLPVVNINALIEGGGEIIASKQKNK